MKTFDVAIHDLNAQNIEIVHSGIELLRSLTISKPQLAVIPGETFSRDLDRYLAQSECELWIHGWKHFVPPEEVVKRNSWGRILLQVTQNQAEFAGLPLPVLKELLDESLKIATQYQVTWHGFTPPTWWANRPLKSMILDKGLAFESRFGFHLPHFIFSVPISFPTGVSKATWKKSMQMQRHMISSPLPLRVVFHPDDFEEDRISDTEDFLKHCLKHRNFAKSTLRTISKG